MNGGLFVPGFWFLVNPNRPTDGKPRFRVPGFGFRVAKDRSVGLTRNQELETKKPGSRNLEPGLRRKGAA